MLTTATKPPAATAEKNSQIPESVLNDAMTNARLAPPASLASALDQVRRAALNLDESLFPKDYKKLPERNQLDAELGNGLRLPDGTQIAWASRYGENVEGRLYIEKDGVGVSYRQHSKDYVYTYAYDPKKGVDQMVRELSFIEFDSRDPQELPQLERLQDQRAHESKRFSPVSESPAEVQVAAAFLTVAGNAIRNLRIELSESVKTLTLPKAG